MSFAQPLSAEIVTRVVRRSTTSGIRPMSGIGKNWDSEILLPLVLEKALPSNFSRFLLAFPDRIDPYCNCLRVLVVILSNYC